MLGSVEATIYRWDKRLFAEERVVRGSEVAVCGYSLAFGVNYTVSIGSMETSIQRIGMMPFVLTYW